MSVWPRRRPAVPGYAREWLEIGERVLAFGWTPYGDLVMATPRGLWITDHDTPPPTAAAGARHAPVTGESAEQPRGRRMAWESIVTAKWTGDVLTVTPAEEVAPQIMKRLPPVVLPLPESGDLPRVVRQRVDRSVALSFRRPLSAATTALLVARRVSGRDGLLWYAVFDRDCDASNEDARRQALELLELAAAAQAPKAYLD